MEPWLLDLNLDGDRIALWFKYPAKVVCKWLKYQPCFYVVPRKVTYPEMDQILNSHPHVDKVELVQRFHPIQDHERRPVFQVFCDRLSAFHKTWRDIEALDKADICNVDFPLVQKWMYETGFFPMARVKYSSSTGDTLEALELCDSQETIQYDIPDLTRLKLDIAIKTPYLVAREEDPLKWIRLLNGEEIVIEQLSEHDMLLELMRTMRALDPDIIETANGDNFLFPYLIARASKYGLANRFTLSRDGVPLKNCLRTIHGSGSYFSYGVMYYRSPRQYYLHGRLHIDNGNGTHAFPLQGMPGMIEVARLTLSPLQLVSRITIGQAMSSMQFYKAHQLGILIPQSKTNTAEHFKSGLKMLQSDRGGFIFSPIVGFFENVAETDFSSMYPTIMLTRNISPETVLCSCHDSPLRVPELDYNVCNKRRGLIPQALELVLTKRKAYKLLAKQGKDRYASIEKALKWILVTSFGYTGYRNARFGRIEAHESVTAWARKILLEAAHIADDFKLEIIHGIVDSLWLKGSTDDSIYAQYCEAVSAATEIEMQHKGIFKWVVFLPTKAIPDVGALTHYYGVFRDGTIKVRGLEVRRHDTPLYVKQAQDALLQLLAKANDWRQFQNLLPKAYKLLQQFIKRIMDGDVDPTALLLTMRLSRLPEEYQNHSRQALAAWQCKRLGMDPQPGKMVQYLLTNSQAKRPQDRVLLAQLLAHTDRHYDRSAYRALLERMFENMLLFMKTSKSTRLVRNKQLVGGGTPS